MYEEQHQMATDIDRQLLKRLLGYARKHTMAITVSLLLLIIVVGIDLVRPIIIGRAVDEVIVNYAKVYSPSKIW